MTQPAHLDVEGYLADPAAELRRCQAQHWYADGLGLDGLPQPMVLAHADARAVLRDRRLSARSFCDDMAAAGISAATVAQLTPLFGRDGDAHRVHRGLLSSAFTPRQVETLRPVVRDVADDLAARIAAGGGRCELVAAFAEPLPPRVFAGLFGLPASEHATLARWGSTIARAFAPGMTPEEVAAVEAVAGEMRERCAVLIAERRAAPGAADDLVTRLVEAEVEGERLADEEIVAMITGFLFAGVETTKRQITAAVLLLAHHPGEWERLAADPALVPGAVEEVLRHRGIVPGLTRLVVDPYEHDDLSLAPGGRLVVSFDAANHDPTVFADPDRFDPGRENAGEHLTFGWGPHFCAGAGLARVELSEALAVLVARFGPPEIEGVGETPVAGMGAPDALDVTFPVRG